VVEVRKEDDGIRITVKDEGIGCDISTLEPGPDTKKGIGLFTTEDRIRFLGGTFAVESSPGKGFCAIVSVPDKKVGA
jgi:signal transduction histidine kinase